MAEVKVSASNAGDPGSIPGLGRSSETSLGRKKTRKGKKICQKTKKKKRKEKNKEIK